MRGSCGMVESKINSFFPSFSLCSILPFPSFPIFGPKSIRRQEMVDLDSIWLFYLLTEYMFISLLSFWASLFFLLNSDNTCSTCLLELFIHLARLFVILIVLSITTCNLSSALQILWWRRHILAMRAQHFTWEMLKK